MEGTSTTPGGQRVAELRAQPPAELLVAQPRERVAAISAPARAYASPTRARKRGRGVQRGVRRHVEQLPQVELQQRRADPPRGSAPAAARPISAAAQRSATGRYFTFRATQSASKFATVPPEVRCPHCRSGS